MPDMPCVAHGRVADPPLPSPASPASGSCCGLSDTSPRLNLAATTFPVTGLFTASPHATRALDGHRRDRRVARDRASEVLTSWALCSCFAFPMCYPVRGFISLQSTTTAPKVATPGCGDPLALLRWPPDQRLILVVARMSRVCQVFCGRILFEVVVGWVLGLGIMWWVVVVWDAPSLPPVPPPSPRPSPPVGRGGLFVAGGGFS